jgi:hypothetical protein
MQPASPLRYVTRLLQIPFYVLPVVDGVDEFDFVYFKSAVNRDIAWLRTFDGAPTTALGDVLKQLEALNALSPRWVYSGYLAQCWTEYAALHSQLLGQLPRAQWGAAIGELACQDRKVLASSRDTWRKLLADTRAAAQAGRPDTPALLQGLFNEIEFARQYTTLRIAKYIRLSSIASLLIAGFSLVGAYFLSAWRAGDYERPVVWLVVLFGLLGGAVSALRQNDQVIGENRAGLRVAEAQLRLRPLLGGMAALVVYGIAQSGILFQILPGQDAKGLALLQIRVSPDNVPMAYYVLGFLSGFSERFFLSVLDRVGERFSDPAPTTSAPAPAPAGTGTPGDAQSETPPSSGEPTLEEPPAPAATPAPEKHG